MMIVKANLSLFISPNKNKIIKFIFTLTNLYYIVTAPAVRFVIYISV